MKGSIHISNYPISALINSQKVAIACEQFTWGYPLEVHSGAIDQSDVHESLLSLQLNTQQGLWNLYGVQQSDVSAEEVRKFLEDVERRHKSRVHWSTRRPSIVIPTSASRTVSSNTPVGSPGEAPLSTPIARDWRKSPDQLLTKLRDQSLNLSQRIEAVLFAEVAQFNSTEASELLPLLFDFVNKYRFAEEASVKTAVGAAIRKLAMGLPDAQIEQYANLFQSTDTDAVPPELELELAKAILWRLAVLPSSLAHEFPTLEGRLLGITNDYMKRRFVLQKNYASTVLHASLCLLLLAERHLDTVLQSVKQVGLGWFSDLFKQRLSRLRDALTKTGDPAALPAVERLDHAISALGRSTKADHAGLAVRQNPETGDQI